MPFFEKLSEQDRDLLASLPYRAGVRISACDSSGGAEADYEELHSLETIMEKRARATHRSVFVQEVMGEAMERQKSWKKWAEKESIATVPHDCKRAVALVAATFGEKEADAYRENIMHIGTEVAKAFLEKGANENFIAGICAVVRSRLEEYVGKMSGNKPQRLANISAAEKAALEEIERAMREGMAHRVQKGA